VTIWCGKCHGVFTHPQAFREHKCLGGKVPSAPVVKA
jgi:hypothetical protein